MYQIIWDEKARLFLKKLNPPDAKRIIKKINSIADDPKHYLRSLAGIEGYKLRIGDYRALIDLNENNKTIVVLLIGHRKNIYEQIKRK